MTNLNTYIVSVPNDCKDHFGKVLDMVSYNSKIKPYGRIGSIVPGNTITIYSIALADDEVVVMKLSTAAEYEKYTGTEDLAWYTITSKIR